MGPFLLHPPIGPAAIVNREADPTLVDQGLLRRKVAVPGLVDDLHVRPAVDVDEYRIATTRLPLRAEHAVVEVGAVRALDRAERRLDVAVEIRRVGMRSVERIFLDPGDALAGCVG